MQSSPYPADPSRDNLATKSRHTMSLFDVAAHTTCCCSEVLAELRAAWRTGVDGDALSDVWMDGYAEGQRDERNFRDRMEMHEEMRRGDGQ